MIAGLLAAAPFSLDPVADFASLTEFPFMVNALEAGAVVAIMAAVVGWFMVLRRQTFAGHTLSVMAFPGASGAALLGLPLASGYFAFSALAAVMIAIAGGTARRRGRSQESAVIGAVQAFGFAAGFLFLSLYGGVFESLESLLFGSFLGITRGAVVTLLSVSAGALAFAAVAGRPLLFASIDEELAGVNGVPVRGLSVAFLLVLGAAVAATAQITGVLLVFALLVAPAAAAQAITTRIAASLLLSVVIAVAVTWGGLALAYFTDGPVGFFVTTLAFGVFAAARILGAARAGRWIGRGAARRCGPAAPRLAGDG